MPKKPIEDADEEIVDLEEAVKMIKRKVMSELEPTIAEVQKCSTLLKDAPTKEAMNALSQAITDLRTEIQAIKDTPAATIDMDTLKAELRAELVPLIKTETQATFREVLQRLGVKPSTLDTGDMTAIVSELLPSLMPAVMGSGGLAALAGRQAPQETVDIPARRELSDAEKKALQTTCQTCGKPAQIRSSENECKHCGAMNYAYRCYACKDVYLTMLSPDEIGGTECPVCGASVKSSKRR